MRNQVQLITYVDRLSGGGFRELQSLMDGPLSGLLGGAHLLPFFRPIDGAAAGFDPIDHTQPDPRLGTWEVVGRLARGRGPVGGPGAGCDPLDHTHPDPRLGTWEEVGRLARGRDLMADLIVNHVSNRSP